MSGQQKSNGTQNHSIFLCSGRCNDYNDTRCRGQGYFTYAALSFLPSFHCKYNNKRQSTSCFKAVQYGNIHIRISIKRFHVTVEPCYCFNGNIDLKTKTRATGPSVGPKGWHEQYVRTNPPARHAPVLDFYRHRGLYSAATTAPLDRLFVCPGNEVVRKRQYDV